MTLIEGMVTVAILSIVGLTLARMLEVSFRQSKTTGNVSDYNEFINELRAVVGDGPMCSAALAGRLFTAGPVTLLAPAPMPNPPLPLATGQRFHSVAITDLELKNISNVVCTPACPGRKTGFVYVDTDFDNANSRMLTFGILAKGTYMPVYVDTDASNHVISCLGRMGDGPSQLCINLGGVFIPGPTNQCQLPGTIKVDIINPAVATAGTMKIVSAPGRYSYCALIGRATGGDEVHEGCSVVNTGPNAWAVVAYNNYSPNVTCTMACAK